MKTININREFASGLIEEMYFNIWHYAKKVDEYIMTNKSIDPDYYINKYSFREMLKELDIDEISNLLLLI